MKKHYKPWPTSALSKPLISLIAVAVTSLTASVILDKLLSGGHPACTRDPASIKTSVLDPSACIRDRLIFETHLVLYYKPKFLVSIIIL